MKHRIFESPMGIGKTLSIICANMSWLKKFEAEYVEKLRLRIDQLKSESEFSDRTDTHGRI